MRKPVAILCSDVHYSLNTLELADEAMALAIEKANGLNIPLIVAGDLHDTKANMRAECINAMLKTFAKAKNCIIIRGNHDQINEKSKEHGLHFLHNDLTWIADDPTWTAGTHGVYVIPYQHDPDEFRKIIKSIPKSHIVVAHQGLAKTNSGEYVQDKSAINPEDVAGMRVISGHYHTRQTIALPDGGRWDYIGNPYTLNFAEANDPPKGFQILYDDGSLEFVPTNLRKHVVIKAEKGITSYGGKPEKGDLVLVKLTGTKEWLATQTKQTVAEQCSLGDLPFRLDIIQEASDEQKRPVSTSSHSDLLDTLIDQQNASDELKTRLKQLWRGM